MRARYYDPVVGRFASEDPALSGNNWFAYCNGDPINSVDSDGKQGRRLNALDYGLFSIGSTIAYSAAFMALYLAGEGKLSPAMKKVICGMCLLATVLFAVGLAGNINGYWQDKIAEISAAVVEIVNYMVDLICEAKCIKYPGVAIAIAAYFVEALTVVAALKSDGFDLSNS
jgi:hypothetical protein